MYLIVTIRKEVTDIQEAETKYETIKTKLSDVPNLVITGSVSNHFESEET